MSLGRFAGVLTTGPAIPNLTRFDVGVQSMSRFSNSMLAVDGAFDEYTGLTRLDEGVFTSCCVYFSFSANNLYTVDFFKPYFFMTSSIENPLFFEASIMSSF